MTFVIYISVRKNPTIILLEEAQLSLTNRTTPNMQCFFSETQCIFYKLLDLECSEKAEMTLKAIQGH